jgi:ABC-type microcin C transport system permease subunit YejE
MVFLACIALPVQSLHAGSNKSLSVCNLKTEYQTNPMGIATPNTVSVIVTYAPFSVSGGIVALTSLDYLGFGLAPPTPSWGELLQQGWDNMDAWWIVGSVIAAMVLTLILVTFIGEAVREAFDPKLHSTYE